MHTTSDQHKQLETCAISDEEGFKNLRKEWMVLFADSHCNEAFLSWEWLFAWWSCHKAGKYLWLITVRRNTKLAGIAPLMLVKVKKHGCSFRVLTNLGEPDNDISNVIACEGDEEVIKAICNYLAARQTEWDALVLHEVYECSRNIRAFIKEFGRKRYAILTRRENHHYLPIQTDWHSYFERLPHALTGYLHHHIDKAKKSGEVRFEVYTGKNLKWEHFEMLFTISKKSRYAYLYKPECEHEFARKLLELTGGQGLELDILYLNQAPVSFNFGFNLAGRHEGWRRAFDQTYSKVGVGTIMSKYLIKSLFDRQFVEFDFLRGLEAYKREWDPTEREFMEVRIVHPLRIRPAIFFIWLSKLKTWWMTKKAKK